MRLGLTYDFQTYYHVPQTLTVVSLTYRNIALFMFTSFTRNLGRLFNQIARDSSAQRVQC